MFSFQMNVWSGVYLGLLILFSIISLYYLSYLPTRPREEVFIRPTSYPASSSLPSIDALLEEQKDLHFKSLPSTTSLLDPNTFHRYLTLCEKHEKAQEQPLHAPRKNQRAEPSIKEILIQNATVYDGLGNVLENHDIHMKDGLIHRLGPRLPYTHSDSLDVINVHGQVVTPGIVDMHTHVGLSSAPFFSVDEEANEMDQPIHPEMRAIDAFNMYDYALPHILAGGVTSTLLLPGSGNLIGGEGYVLKTPVPHSRRVKDMLIQADLTRDDAHKTGAPFRRWMKMACGENALRAYGMEKKQPPFTRMGSAQHMRNALTEASKVRAQQDEWCTIARFLKPVQFPKTEDPSSESAQKHKEDPKRGHYYLHPKGHYPSSNEWDTLVALLRGHVGLHWHCYLAFDAETQLRIADDFNVSVKAFHHALDLHHAIPLLKEHRVGVAIFADHWAYKPEAYTASVHAAKLFWKHGVHVAFKSDHPVTNARYLVYESAKSIQYGLSPQAWIQSITSVPATLLDLAHRIGSIQVGMDADVVLWNAPPMAIGARPTEVYADGKLAFQDATVEKFAPNAPMFQKWDPAPSVQGKYLLLKNAQIVLGKELKQNMQLLINPSGVLDCIGTLCPLKDSSESVIYDLHGAILTPPLISTGTELGFVEINQEPDTIEHGGMAPDIWTSAVNGWQAGGKVEYASVNQGILWAISAPPTISDLSFQRFSISGLFVLNKTVPMPLASPVAVHVSECIGSFAQYVELLQFHLPTIRAYNVPFVIKAENANHLATLLSLKQKVASNMTWIIQGAAEADLVMDQLATTPNVTLLLTTSRCAPYTWNTRRCSTNLIPVLKKHNIPFILSTPPYTVSEVRNLRFEAGWARRLANLNFVDMVNLVTTDILKAFNLEKSLVPFKMGAHAQFLIWNGDFGEIDTQLMYVVDGTSREIIHAPKNL